MSNNTMDYTFLVILALGFGAMWLMTSRTRKQQKAAADFRANLAPGQEVMTGSGMFATVVDVEDDVVTLETAPGVTSRWLRPAIAKLVEPPVADEEVEDEEDLDDEYEDDEDYLEDDEQTQEPDPSAPVRTTTSSGLLEDHGPDPVVPDDASSLTADPDPGDPPRR